MVQGLTATAGCQFPYAWETSAPEVQDAVKGLSCGDTLTGDFAQTGLTLPATIAVGETVPVSVEFLPTVAGSLTGTLTLISDDPDEASVEVSLSGDALIAPVIETIS